MNKQPRSYPFPRSTTCSTPPYTVPILANTAAHKIYFSHMSERNPNFLKTKFSLQSSPEVTAAATRTERKTGQPVEQKASSLIQNYLDRFTEIMEQKGERKQQGIEALKQILHKEHIIKPVAIPESIFLLEQRIARELGHGEIEITAELRQRKTNEVINAQKQSLDRWIDYLASEDARYPDWTKYWTMRSILGMGKIKKEQDSTGKETVKFLKRTKDTAAAFPPLNPRALAMTIEAVQLLQHEKAGPKSERKPIKNLSIKLDDKSFQALVAAENFSEIYAQFLIEMPEYSTEGLQEIRGQWTKYDRGSNADHLVKSLEGYPLEWCTAAYDTAQTQLQAGDFYVYYSLNEEKKPTIPRVAIRMEADKIAEVRGIAPGQELDPYIAPVVAEKMKEFPDGVAYEKKAADMKHLTAIEHATRQGQSLTKDDLIFLYEINALIKGFGYERDPRIDELQRGRDPKVDAPVMLECSTEEIAWNQAEITEKTRAYVGPLFPGIFKQRKHLEHIYTEFPNRRISFQTVEIDNKTPKQLLKEYTKRGFFVRDDAKDMTDHLSKKNADTDRKSWWKKIKFAFVKDEKKEVEYIETTCLAVRDLGFTEDATDDQIYKKAEEYGLELCSADVGLNYYLQYRNKRRDINEPYIAMKQIFLDSKSPRIFGLDKTYGKGCLIAVRALKTGPSTSFLFRHRKSET